MHALDQQKHDSITLSQLENWRELPALVSRTRSTGYGG